jgi:hypothetical protein
MIDVGIPLGRATSASAERVGQRIEALTREQAVQDVWLAVRGAVRAQQAPRVRSPPRRGSASWCPRDSRRSRAARSQDQDAAPSLVEDIEAQGHTIDALYIDRGYITAPIFDEFEHAEGWSSAGRGARGTGTTSARARSRSTCAIERSRARLVSSNASSSAPPSSSCGDVSRLSAAREMHRCWPWEGAQGRDRSQRAARPSASARRPRRHGAASPGCVIMVVSNRSVL